MPGRRGLGLAGGLKIATNSPWPRNSAGSRSSWGTIQALGTGGDRTMTTYTCNAPDRITRIAHHTDHGPRTVAHGAIAEGLGPWALGLGPWAMHGAPRASGLGLGAWGLGLGAWGLGLGAWGLGLGAWGTIYRVQLIMIRTPTPTFSQSRAGSHIATQTRGSRRFLKQGPTPLKFFKNFRFALPRTPPKFFKKIPNTRQNTPRPVHLSLNYNQSTPVKQKQFPTGNYNDQDPH